MNDRPLSDAAAIARGCVVRVIDGVRVASVTDAYFASWREARARQRTERKARAAAPVSADYRLPVKPPR